MHRVELKDLDKQVKECYTFQFLMHRVELKGLI